MHRRWVLFLLAVGTLALIACSRHNLKQLTVDEVATRIAAHDDKTFVYDCNAQERFTESHLPGAHWVAYQNVTATDLPRDQSATLVFYCASEL